MTDALVTAGVLGAVVAVAAPYVQAAGVSERVSGNAKRLAASASFARAEALRRKGVVVLCKSTDGARCTTAGGWEQGWIVFHDSNKDGVKDAPEALLLHEGPAPDGYRITEGSGTSSLAFQPRSAGTTIARWTVCRFSPSVHAQMRHVAVSATGRPTIRHASGSSCT